MDSAATLSKGTLGIVGAFPERYREQVLISYNGSLVRAGVPHRVGVNLCGGSELAWNGVEVCKSEER